MTLLVVAVVLVVAVAFVRFVGHQQELVVTRHGRPIRTRGPGPALVVPLLESGRRIDTAVRRQWTAVTAVTADGARAHLQVEYAVRVTNPVAAPEDADDLVADEVENRVRQGISRVLARDLPDGGDPLPWAPESFAPGVVVEHITVNSADIAVTPELRRLLVPATGRAWT